MTELKKKTQRDKLAKLPLPFLKHYFHVHYDVQKVRIAAVSRLQQVGEVMGIDFKFLIQQEKQIRDYLDYQTEKIKVCREWLKPKKGIGPLLSAGLVSILDIHKAPHPSSFWKYCGLHVVDGKSVKRVRGRKLDFNPDARTLAWKIADSFVKQRTPVYRDIYDRRRPIEEKKLNYPIGNVKACPEYTECLRKRKEKAKRTGRPMKPAACRKHIYRRACRVMVKRFLLDFWTVWRRMEGLPPSEPYAVAILKHDKTEVKQD